MATILNDLLSSLEPDPWRAESGFSSADFHGAHEALIRSEGDPEFILSKWIQANQPCLFGRLTAKQGLLRYCILREEDISSDERARDTIQLAREKWKKDAFDGAASGFIVLLVSERIANAKPSAIVAKLATRLCELYLREVDVRLDAVHHERLWLQKPGKDQVTWEWLSGVNYFCAQGDKRWWHDHRIPGGIAFSTNSVGHLAKSGRMAELMTGLNTELGLSGPEYEGSTVRSLNEALRFAMQTIDKAATTVSGKATNLLDFHRNEDSPSLPPCPITLPSNLAGKNHCIYQGWYHTDFTLPSEYFRPDIERPAEISSQKLDFTYLFHRDVENSAHETMGLGQRIRGEEDEESAVEAKAGRSVAREVAIRDCPELERILRHAK